MDEVSQLNGFPHSRGIFVQLGLGLIVQLGLGLKLNTKIQIHHHHHPPPTTHHTVTFLRVLGLVGG